jgi:ATP adenylyltransferase
MRSLFTPWRYEYLAGPRPTAVDCIFCAAREPAGSEPPAPSGTDLVVHRAARNFIILNRYPYANGHMMIVPNEHLSSPAASDHEQRAEMFDLAATCEAALREVYAADGINMGMNLGRAAGAGIESHFHLHVVPRWEGDTNFMAVTADTRIIPEDFDRTRERLQVVIRRLLAGGGSRHE